MRNVDIQELLQGYIRNFKLATGMELTVSYTAGMKLEMEEVKDKVTELLGADPKHRCRREKWVDARIIYTMIVREMGYTFVDIGKSLAMDHTSIMYFAKNKRVYHEDFQQKMQIIKTWLMAKEQEETNKQELQKVK